MADAVLQRKNMVESQVRPSDVTDRRVTAAMTAIPREKFIPGHLAKFAYSDETLTIAAGRVMLPPSTLARLAQLAEVAPGDNVLVIGGACGYAAAILSQIAQSIVALLPDNSDAENVSKTCLALGINNVTTVTGPLASGWVSKAPYAVIFVEGGVETIPDALKAQLGEGGRLVAVEVEHGLGHAFLLHKRAGSIARREEFQASAPLLPGFEAVKPAFVF